MANKNISSPTAAKIFAAWESEGRSERPRTYLGASIIGHECDMYLWLNFRGAVRENFDGRMYRLFDRGRREEAVFCADLRRIGCEVREFDENGSQFAVKDFGGHFAGHLDGLAKGLAEAPKQWIVTEFKTHSDSSFRKLCKDGVKVAKPMHYAQMQTYMGKTDLKKALYMAVNKDNDDLWCEIIDFDKAAYDLIMARAKHIIDTATPDRCSTRPDDFRCKACPCASVCWHDNENFIDPSVPETCRTCCHASADTEHEGACWKCRLGHSCTTEGKCEDYLVLPVFVMGTITGGDDYGIEYAYVDAPSITEGKIVIGKRGVSAEEAKKFGPAEAIGVSAIKDAVPGAKVVASNDLERKYTGPGYEKYFAGTQGELVKWCDGACVRLTDPIRSESGSDREYYEYDNNWCVCRFKNEDKFIVYGDQPPF